MSKLKNNFYISAFDGLRCFALILVLLYHGDPAQFPGGWIGVDLFFVLSGYLITGLLAAEVVEAGRVRLGRFYIRRALRLLPALVAAVLFAGFLWPVTDHLPHRLDWLPTAKYVLAYAANLYWGELLGSLNHCWSLAVEEHYYLIWPPLFLLAWRIGGRRGAIAAALAGVVGVIAYRLVGCDYLISRGIEPYRFTLTRADSLLIGSATALLIPKSGKGRSRLAGMILGLGLAFGVFLGFCFDFVHYSRWMNQGGYALIAVGAAVMVVAATRQSAVAEILSASPLVWVGKRSYGLYLYHLPIYHFTQPLWKGNSLRNLICLMGLRLATTMVVAAISYRYLELPFLTLKGRMDRPKASKGDNPMHLAGMHDHLSRDARKHQPRSIGDIGD